MRDFRDAKAMAHSLRDALKAKAIQTTHSESLELIAKAFGYDNWNILSARIDSQNSNAAACPQNQTPQEKLLYCSFCGKSQHDVQKLVAGPAVFICDECIDLCVDIVDEQLLRLTEGDETSARAMSTERLQHYVEHATKGAERNRLALQGIESMIAYADDVPAIDDSAMPLSSSPFRNKTAEELRVMQKHSLDQLKRYEQAMRTATPIIDERMASS